MYSHFSLGGLGQGSHRLDRPASPQERPEKDDVLVQSWLGNLAGDYFGGEDDSKGGSPVGNNRGQANTLPLGPLASVGELRAGADGVAHSLLGFKPPEVGKTERNHSFTTTTSHTSYPSDAGSDLGGDGTPRRRFSNISSGDLGDGQLEGKVSFHVKPHVSNTSAIGENPKFEITVSNGCYSWQITRSYDEFVMLNGLLDSKSGVESKFLLPPLYVDAGFRQLNDHILEGLAGFLRRVSSQLPEMMESHFVDFISAEKHLFVAFAQLGDLHRSNRRLEHQAHDQEMQLKNSNSLIQILFSRCQEMSNRLHILENRLFDAPSDGAADETRAEGGVHFKYAQSTCSSAEGDEASSVSSRPSLVGKIWDLITPNSPLLPDRRLSFRDNHDWAAELIPQGSERTALDEALDSIVMHVWPLRTQTAHRSFVQDFTAKMIKSILNLRAFPTGMYVLDCFLPHDPISFTLFCRTKDTQDGHWCSQLSEYFSQLASGNSLEDLENSFENLMPKELSNHSVENVHIVRQERSSGMDCALMATIDKINVEIRVSNQTDLIFASFVEEICSLVGKDNLFKRTWLLLSSWWRYEVCDETAMQRSSLRSHDTYNQLLLMLMAVFNLHHEIIHQPLQALSIFFCEYGGIDLTKHVITLFGVYPLDALRDNSICTRPQHLVSASVMDRYFKWYNTVKKNRIDRERSTPPGSVAASGVTGSSNISSSGSVTSGNGSVASVQSVFNEGMLNVAHPLCLTDNMAGSVDSDTDAHTVMLTEALSDGANAMHLILETGTQATIHAFWQEVVMQFKNGFRPDVGNLHDVCTPGPELRCTFMVDQERLLEEISYSAMVAAGEVSERSLRLLFRDMLTERGSLPVGEIGKTLQESTGFDNLTSTLKSTYGGLKKFLEICSDEFLIGKNHPFNPHVYLLKFLTPEEIQTVADGGILVNNQSKMKKKANQRRRNSYMGQGSGGGSAVGGGSGYSQQDHGGHTPGMMHGGGGGSSHAYPQHHPRVGSGGGGGSSGTSLDAGVRGLPSSQSFGVNAGGRDMYKYSQTKGGSHSQHASQHPHHHQHQHQHQHQQYHQHQHHQSRHHHQEAPQPPFRRHSYGQSSNSTSNMTSSTNSQVPGGVSYSLSTVMQAILNDVRMY